MTEETKKENTTEKVDNAEVKADAKVEIPQNQQKTPEQVMQESVNLSKIIVLRMLNVAAIHSFSIMEEYNRLNEKNLPLNDLRKPIYNENIKLIRQSLELAVQANSLFPMGGPGRMGMPPMGR